MRLRLKSPSSQLLIQPFIQAQIKENTKAPRHWLLCGEFTGTGEFPAQMTSNAENLMTSSCRGVGYWIPSQYKDVLLSVYGSHYKGKTVVRTSYLCNGNSYTGKTTSLYWDGPLTGEIKWIIRDKCREPTKYASWWTRRNLKPDSYHLANFVIMITPVFQLNTLTHSYCVTHFRDHDKKKTKRLLPGQMFILQALQMYPIVCLLFHTVFSFWNVHSLCANKYQVDNCAIYEKIAARCPLDVMRRYGNRCDDRYSSWNLLAARSPALVYWLPLGMTAPETLAQGR